MHGRPIRSATCRRATTVVAELAEVQEDAAYAYRRYAIAASIAGYPTVARGGNIGLAILAAKPASGTKDGSMFSREVHRCSWPNHRNSAAAWRGRRSAALALAAPPAAPPARRRPASARSIRPRSSESKQDTNLKPHATPPTVDSGRQAAARQDQAAGRLQGRGLVQRPSRRAHHGRGPEGHDLHGHAPTRPRLCDHQQGRQARGEDAAAGPDPAERPRRQGRRALRVRDQQGVPLRQHRGQSRQSRRPASS